MLFSLNFNFQGLLGNFKDFSSTFKVNNFIQGLSSTCGNPVIIPIDAFIVLFFHKSIELNWSQLRNWTDSDLQK